MCFYIIFDINILLIVIVKREIRIRLIWHSKIIIFYKLQKDVKDDTKTYFDQFYLPSLSKYGLSDINRQLLNSKKPANTNSWFTIKLSKQIYWRGIKYSKWCAFWALKWKK